MARKSPAPSSLDYYEDALLYEATFRDRTHDIAYYLELSRKVKGPILEYGAGAGRVTLPLLRDGATVTCVDRSAKMLTLLRQRLRALPPEARERVRLKRGDMTKVRGLGRYPLVLATFNVVGHLSTFEEMAAFLGCVRHHLARGGEFVFDVPVPSAEELGADPDEWFRAPRFKHPKTGEWLSQAERFEYDPISQVLRVESEFRRQGSRDAVTVPLVLRQWFPKELESLLYYTGFREVRLTADYTGQGLYGDVDMLVVHAS